MNIFRYIFICVCLQFFTFSCKSSDVISCPPISNEDYQIYNLLIDSFYVKSSFRSNVLSKNSIVIDDSTNLGKHKSGRIFYDDGTEFNKLVDMAKDDSSITTDLINDFFIKNLSKHKLDSCRFHRSNLITTFIKDKYKTHNWDLFYKDFPISKGYMDFSRVGYNSINTKSVVYCQIHRDGLNGVGLYVLFHKINNTWMIKYYIEDWCA